MQLQCQNAAAAAEQAKAWRDLLTFVQYLQLAAVDPAPRTFAPRNHLRMGAQIESLFAIAISANRAMGAFQNLQFRSASHAIDAAGLIR